MRLIAVLIVTFFCTSAAASGRLMLEPFWNDSTEQYGTKVGLAVYQKLIPMFYFNSYSGIGLLEKEPGHWGQNWMTLKNGLVFQPLNRLTIEPGLELRHGYDCTGRHCDEMMKDWEKQYYVKVGFQLW